MSSKRSENGKKIKRKARVIQCSYLIFLFAILTLILVSSPQGTEALAPVRNLSDNAGSSLDPQIGVSSNNVYVVWRDDTAGNFDIFVKRSTDAGATFTVPKNISNSTGSSNTPQIAAEGSNVYLVWQEEASSPEGNSNGEIFFAASTDAGATFSEPKNISNSTGVSDSPQIAAAGNTVYLVWQDQNATSGTTDVLFAASTDAGATFTVPKNISNSTGSSTSPQIAVGSAAGVVAVAWSGFVSENSEVFVVSSSDHGDNFGTPLDVSRNDGGSEKPQLAMSGNKSYLVWQDQNATSGTTDILFAASTDAGSTFSEPKNISNNAGGSFEPRIASAGGDNVYVVWRDIDATDPSSGRSDIMFGKSTDAGATFSEPKNISNNAGGSFEPEIALLDSTNRVYVDWRDEYLGNSNGEIFSAASIDGGSSFGCAINLSNTEANSFFPRMAVSEAGGVPTNFSVMYDVPLDGPASDVYLQKSNDTDYQREFVSLDFISSHSPKWGLEPVSISGSAGNAASDDTITVDWGDGTSTTDIPITGCFWGPVDHLYDGDAIGHNPNQIVARLVSSGGETKTTSVNNYGNVEVNVQKHTATLTLNQILSQRQGSNVTVTGSLFDQDAGSGIGNKTITFDGTGATGLPSLGAVTSTDGTGTFSAIGVTPENTGREWTVQAHFASDSIYEGSNSTGRSYDTVSSFTPEFGVAAGQNSTVSITVHDFNASISFQDVLADGRIFAQECATQPSENTRFTSIGVCIDITPAIELPPDSIATIKMSIGGSFNETKFAEVDIFREAPAGHIVDITHLRDVDTNTITGQTAAQSGRFIAGIALHSPKPTDAARQQIFVGSEQTVMLRDISNRNNVTSSAVLSNDNNSTVSIRLNKSEYRIGDASTLTIQDEEADLDQGIRNTVPALINSTGNAVEKRVTLMETGNSTGKFEGNFTITSSDGGSNDNTISVPVNATPSPSGGPAGGNITVFYLGTHARMKAVLDGVGESGLVEMSDYVVDTTSDPSNVLPFLPIGGAANVTLVDAALSSNGRITVSLSYANAVLGGQDPLALHMWQRIGNEWIEITLPESAVDAEAKTVTGEAIVSNEFSTAQFSLACNECGGGIGGGGGGLQRPGIGVVLDFVASVLPNAASPTVQNTGSRGGGGGGTSVDITTFSEKYLEDNPLQKVQLQSTAFKDNDGRSISLATLGQQVNIQTSFKNYQPHEQDYAMIMQVIDQDGFTTDIGWVTGTLSSGQSTDASRSWVAVEAGPYMVKLFVWDNIRGLPNALSEPTNKMLLIK